MKAQPIPMTNEVAGGKFAAAGVSVMASLLSWIPHLEAVLRVGASLLSIVAGAIVIWPKLRRTFRKRKPK